MKSTVRARISLDKRSDLPFSGNHVLDKTVKILEAPSRSRICSTFLIRVKMPSQGQSDSNFANGAGDDDDLRDLRDLKRDFEAISDANYSTCLNEIIDTIRNYPLFFMLAQEDMTETSLLRNSIGFPFSAIHPADVSIPLEMIPEKASRSCLLLVHLSPGYDLNTRSREPWSYPSQDVRTANISEGDLLETVTVD